MVLVGRLIWQFYYRAGATGACAACGCPCAGTAGAPGTGALAAAAAGVCGCACAGGFAAAAAAAFISPCKAGIDVPRAARVVWKALTSLGSTGIAFLFLTNIAFIALMAPRKSVVVLLGAAVATACSTIGFVSPIIWLMTLSIHSLSDNILFWFL